MIRKQFYVLFLWLTTIISPCAALAAQGDITIDFGGLCPQIVLPANSNPPPDLPPEPHFLFPAGGFLDCTSANNGTTYFRITDKVPYNTANPIADRAQILPSALAPPGSQNTDASADDVLRFYNFKIYAVTPTPSSMPLGYQVTFWREHVAPITSDGPVSIQPDRWYKTLTSGTMKKVVNNWVKMSPGYVTHPVGSAEKAFGTAKSYTVTAVTCPGTICNVNLSTSGKWVETTDPSTWLTGNRVLRVNFSFKFQNGNANPTDANSDWILLNTGAKIYNDVNSDPGLQDECSLQYTQCPSCWSKLFSSSYWTKMTLSKAENSETAKLDMFTKVNWASLQQDMARGGGEYLTSLATLLEVPIEKQKYFFIFAQDQYRAQAEEGMVTRVEMLSRLQEAIAGRPMLVAGTMEPTP